MPMLPNINITTLFEMSIKVTFVNSNPGTVLIVSEHLVFLQRGGGGVTQDV